MILMLGVGVIMEPETKRQKNVDTWGGNCEQERDICFQLKRRLANHNIELLILNDFTRADVLARFNSSSQDEWLPIQVKTTHGLRRQRGQAFRFSNMRGYTGMAVLCISVDPERRWIFDGSVFYTKNIDILPGGKYDKLGKSCDSDEQLAVLIAEMLASNTFATTTEKQARWDIARETHRKEMLTIDAWKTKVADVNGWSFRWPEEQAGAYDFLVSKDCERTWSRVQIKTVQKRPAYMNATGYLMPLTKQAGYVNGKPTHKPYDAGDADIFVGVLLSNTTVDFWTFPAEVISDRFCTATQKGFCNMSVALPPQLSEEQPNDGTQKSRAGAKNRSLWTREFHVRVMCERPS